MSSTRSGVTLALELAPSAALAALLLGVHALSAIVVAVLPLHPVLRVVVMLPILAGAIRSVRRHALLSSRDAIVRVAWNVGARWKLTRRDGVEVDAELLPGSYVHPVIMVLNFRSATRQRNNVLVFSGRADADAIRRLRAELAAQRSAAG